MTLGNLIRNINIQGSMTISIWNSEDEEIFRDTINAFDITIRDVEALKKGLSRYNIKYMYPIDDTIVVEVYG